MDNPLISVPELNDLLGKPELLLFDCRHDLFNTDAGEQAHKAGHIPGAHFLHLDRDLSGEIVPGTTGRHPLPGAQTFANLMSEYDLDHGKQVVAYDDKGGGIAARLWWLLRAIGHENVRVLNGGIPAWEAAGLPLDSGSVPIPSTDYRRKAHPYPAPSYQLGTRDRAHIITTLDYPLIDSRTAERYTGEKEPIDPIAGHIPGAINLPWPENLAGDGLFKTREQLKIRFADLSDKADEATFYCGSGVTACHNLLAYYYAFGEMARLYPGSWSEWITYENKGVG